MLNEIQAHKFCRDDISKIENYDKAIADTTQTWVIHHRLELTLDGEFALTPEQLKMHDMYYNRPYYELIFLTRSEHNTIHNRGMSYDTRQKLSESHKGKQRSEETRRKISESHKGKQYTDEARRKMSESRKGKLKGIPKSIEHRRKLSESHKGKQHSDKARRKMSEAQKRRWAAIKK